MLLVSIVKRSGGVATMTLSPEYTPMGMGVEAAQALTGETQIRWDDPTIYRWEIFRPGTWEDTLRQAATRVRERGTLLARVRAALLVAAPFPIAIAGRLVVVLI